MSIYSNLFIIGFLLQISIFLYKVYNVMTLGKIYNIGMAFILFMLHIIGWLLTLIVFLKYPEQIAYHILFLLCSGILPLAIVFLAIEGFLELGNFVQKIRGRFEGRDQIE